MNNPFIRQCFEAFAQPLFGFAYRTLGDVERANDVVQESFLTLLKKGDHFTVKIAAKVFLFKTARFHMLNQGRDRWRQVLPLEETDGRTDQGTTQSDTTQAVREALSQLPEELLTPLLLKEYHGFKYAEIATMLEIPVGTVRSRLFRARTMMMKSLETMGGFP